MLWLTIENDRKKYAKQYKDAYFNFVKRLWHEQWHRFFSGQESEISLM